MTMRKFLTHITASGYTYLLAPRIPRKGLVSGAVLGLLIALSLLGTPENAHAGSATREEQEKQTVKVDGETRIYVKNSRGKTIIVGRLGATDVSIRAVKYVRAKDGETAEEWMDELFFSVDTDGEQISIISHHPDWAREGGNFWSFLKRIKQKVYIDYTIEVPTEFSAKVSSTSGDVKITSLGGDVKLFGSSGDVFMKDINGSTYIEVSSGSIDVNDIGKNLHVRMSSGDVVIRDIGGTLFVQGSSGDATVNDVGSDAEISLASGDVSLNGCGGDAEVSTLSGDAEIADATGSIKATTTSGDIFATVDPFGPKDNIFKSSSGDVDVVFMAREGYGFVLEVNTNSGAIEGDLDIKLDKISRKMLTGAVGSGDGRIYIETASGDIRIKQMEE